MNRNTFCSIALVVASGLLGCELRGPSPGAHPRILDSDYLLPDGKRWQYEIVLPDDISTDDLLRLEVRRFLIDEVNEGIRGADDLPANEADAIGWETAFRLDSSQDKVHISLQLIDLRDYSASSSVENPIKLVGGLNVVGQIAHIQCAPDFVVGESGGILPSSQTQWRENELRLLRFWTGNEENEFAYDVCVRIVKAD